MATDVSSLPVNGNHGPHGGYDTTGYSQTASSTYSQTVAQDPSSTSDIPKDEVGWFFVTQYYSTLSRNPEKLYLFYNKRSHFVMGDEAEKVPVDVGQKAINERIQERGFKDCKVRITNVDAQASDANIVIQVIGEISVKAQPHRKFVQTFVLAGQTNGYFVLNDVFRYLVDEEEEQVPGDEAPVADEPQYEQAAAATPLTSTPKTLTSSQDPQAVEQSAQSIDRALESKTAPSPTPAVNGTTPTSALQIEEPASTLPPQDEPVAPEPSAPALEPEKPKDPSPTPIPPTDKRSPQPPAAAAAAPPPAPSPAKPAAPKTWANLAAAANRVATPNSSTNQTAPVPAAQPKIAASPAPVAAPSTSTASAPQASQEPAAATDAQDEEWTSVGEHKRQQSRAQPGPAAPEGPQSRAYIKNVHESVDVKELRALLEKYGELSYLDVSRQKNCAFVDFKTHEGYKAALDANPHQLGNDRIIVEERRMKPGSYPYVPRGGMRGGRGGAPGQGAGRGSYQGGRGGSGPQGRGRGGPANGPRGGRGAAQAA